jgi:hypothetical protein
MSTMVTARAIGRPLDRVDGPLKVTGTARPEVRCLRP